MYYRIRYVENNKMRVGVWWPFIEENTFDLDFHILNYLEKYPGQFYDVQYKE